MKFRYIITNLFDGVIEGTNDDQVAKECVVCEEYYVYDSQEDKWLTEEGPVEIKDIRT